MTNNKNYVWPPVRGGMHCIMRSRSLLSITAVISKGFSLALAAGFSSQLAFAVSEPAQRSDQNNSLPAHKDAVVSAISKLEPAMVPRARRVNFEHERASQDARQVADWIVDSGDNRGMPFVIGEKVDAKVFVFTAAGRLSGAASALLGLGQGDDSVPGIGTRKLSSILPSERTTPAGRFVSALGHNVHGGEILWVDYDAAISLHPVITTNPKERRAQRLETPSPLDNRISYGCINVPVKFFKDVVSAAFKRTNGIVYVLPETRSAQKVFASYDVDERERLQAESKHLPAQILSQIGNP